MLERLEHDRRYAHSASVIIVCELELPDDVFKRYPRARGCLIEPKSAVFFIRKAIAVRFEEVGPYVPGTCIGVVILESHPLCSLLVYSHLLRVTVL